jgi:hypothetical protein
MEELAPPQDVLEAGPELTAGMEELAPPQDVLEAGPELTAGGQDAQAISAQEDGVHEEPESAKNISNVPLSVHAALDFGFWTWWLHDP